MKMWKSDNSFWLIIISWVKVNWPTIYGVILAILIAYARLIYDGVDRKNRWIEAMLCGALTLPVSNALEFFGVSASLAPAVGGAVGFIGVNKIREIAIRFLNKRAGGDSHNDY